MNEFLTLFELNNLIKETFVNYFERTYWIVSEISQFSANNSGHAYLELVEKSNNSDKIIAKSRATIWSSSFRMIKPYFESVTGYEFKAGIKVLLNVSIEFHEVYGISLNIVDIDPVYTLGDIEKRRLEILRNLENSGIMNMNKELELPIVIQKIAIITSSSAAGYEDFINQLEKNQFGYKFYNKLFPAIMQGNQAEDSIISAMEKIFTYDDFFDIVVIIRGGGSKTDLSCFDSENMALNICQFTLPVITGIGHDRDVSIADIVAHTSQKTPTAVAEFIISHNNNFEILLSEAKEHFFEQIDNILYSKKSELDGLTSDFKNLISNRILKLSNKLNLLEAKFSSSVGFYLKNKNNEIEKLKSTILNSTNISISTKKQKISNFEFKLNSVLEKYFISKKHQLNLFENIVNYQHPKNILKRGYSITRRNGNALKNTEKISLNEIVETELYNGKIESKINKILSE